MTDTEDEATIVKFKPGDHVRAFGMKDCVVVGAEPFVGYWHLHCSDGISNIHENWLELIQETPPMTDPLRPVTRSDDAAGEGR